MNQFYMIAVLCLAAVACRQVGGNAGDMVSASVTNAVATSPTGDKLVDRANRVETTGERNEMEVMKTADSSSGERSDRAIEETASEGLESMITTDSSSDGVQGKESMQEGRTLRILSFNIREWTRDRDKDGEHFWRKRMEAMRRMIEDVDPDVICLQEVLPPAGQYVPEGYRRVGVGVSHPIFVRKTMKASKHSFAIFWEACTVEGVRVVNVHSRWEQEIVERTVRQVNGQLTGRDVACGDWNTRLRSIESAGLRMLSARVLLGVTEADTFANFTKAESHGPIDHFFVNGVTPLTYRMITDGYGVDRISDHWPIVLDVSL